MKIEKVIKDMEMELTETEIKETLFFEIFVNLTVGEMGKALEQLYSTHYPYISINIKRKTFMKNPYVWLFKGNVAECNGELLKMSFGMSGIYMHILKRVDRDTYAIELSLQRLN